MLTLEHLGMYRSKSLLFNYKIMETITSLELI
jgi:hypothetical protein